VVMMVMMMAGRKHRAGKHQQKQGGKDNLFHGTNVAWTPRRRKCIQRSASREERGCGNWFRYGTPKPETCKPPPRTVSRVQFHWPHGNAQGPRLPKPRELANSPTPRSGANLLLLSCGISPYEHLSTTIPEPAARRPSLGVDWNYNDQRVPFPRRRPQALFL
jgi:hypothetical protein